LTDVLGLREMWQVLGNPKFLDNEAFQKPKIRQKGGFFPLKLHWQLMATVFDPNFGKNMNN